MGLAKGSEKWILAFFILAFAFIPAALAHRIFLIPFGYFLFLLILSIVFFRDTERKIGEGIVAPADGRIMRTDKVENFVRICTFMSILDVHVNRAPLSGKVLSMKHIPGKHRLAFDKDSDVNERLIIRMDTEIGEIRIVQIAGAFARRIIPYIMEGEYLDKGERIGMIALGSRVDLYLPEDKIRINVKEGDKVRAGETKLAEAVM